MAGICVILVFQIMILCTGFVIIWLLVRKKERRVITAIQSPGGSCFPDSEILDI